MAFLQRRSVKDRAVPKAPLPPVAPVSDLTRLRVGGLRLDALDCAFVQIVCACGHTGEVAVAALQDRHTRGTRVRDALGSIRCSRCGQKTIRRVYAHR